MQERSYSSLAYRYGFNGKEKDDEINVEGGDYDFGARIYEGRLGRWLAIDPLRKLMLSFSPYSFAGNSPILVSDYAGMIFIVHGGPIEIEKFKTILNTAFASQIQVQVDKITGVVTLVGDISKLDSKQIALYNALNDVIRDAKTTDVVLLTQLERNQALGGSWQGRGLPQPNKTVKWVNTIDLYDMEIMGSATPDISAAGLIIHEVMETYYNQAKGISDYKTCHDKALIDQGKVDGVYIADQTGYDDNKDKKFDVGFTNFRTIWGKYNIKYQIDANLNVTSATLVKGWEVPGHEKGTHFTQPEEIIDPGDY